MAILMDEKSWYQGYEDGKAGKPNRPQTVKDRFAYTSGYIEGKAFYKE